MTSNYLIIVIKGQYLLLIMTIPGGQVICDKLFIVRLPYVKNMMYSLEIDLRLPLLKTIKVHKAFSYQKVKFRNNVERHY